MFYEGSTTFVFGRFVVNLCESKTGDIALHLNPRMQGKKLVRNALLRQAWGQEELAASEFPFRHGKEFEVHNTAFISLIG